MMNLEQIGLPAFAVTVMPDGTFRYQAVNVAYETWIGSPAAALVGRTPVEALGAEIAERICDHYRLCVAERRLVEYEDSAERPAGRIWWRTSLMPVLADDGRIRALFGICQDKTGEKRLELDIQATNRQLELALRCLKGADWRFDVERGLYHASPNLALLMGEDRPRPVAWSEWAERLFPEDLGGASCELLLSGEAADQVVRFRFRGKRNETRWAQCQRLISTEGRRAPMICGVIVDITDDIHREMRLEAEAQHDSLTGLLNRRGFRKALDADLASPKARNRAFAIYMLDLDGFKLINDRLGHAAGDDVLAEVARRLAATVGEGATIARLGGDEFVAAVPSVGRLAAEALEARMTSALSLPFVRHGQWIAMGGSVGLSWRAGEVNLSEMMVEADERLYQRKRGRKAAVETVGRDQMNLFAA